MRADLDETWCWTGGQSCRIGEDDGHGCYLSEAGTGGARRFGGGARSAGGAAAASCGADTYRPNTELYRAEIEGVDYCRRYRRHAAFDDSQAAAVALPETVVMALHGGGIEPGTSEYAWPSPVITRR